jgi:phosphate/sulfate permease
VSVAKLTPETTPNSNERRLVFIFLAVLGVGIVDVFGILIAGAAGVRHIAPFLVVLPIPCFVIAFALIVINLFTNVRRRSREAREAEEAARYAAKVAAAKPAVVKPPAVKNPKAVARSKKR